MRWAPEFISGRDSLIMGQTSQCILLYVCLCGCREQLTRPASLTDINKTTGVVVAVRGKLLSLEEKRQNSR